MWLTSSLRIVEIHTHRKTDLLTWSLYMQEGLTSGLSNATIVYAAQAIYKLILKPTNSLVNLVVANQTFVDDASGVSLRTVELSVVRVAQPACAIAVRSFLHNLALLLSSKKSLEAR